MPDTKTLGPLVLSRGSPGSSACTSKSPTVDIVAVHGLKGERTASWTHTESSTMWLRDELPRRIPEAHIMTFGYESEINSREEVISVGGIRQTALELLEAVIDGRKLAQHEISGARGLGQCESRPIVFIGHNIGGTIIKQALLIANYENRYLPIAVDTSLLIFFGTPHHASTFSDWQRLTINIVSASMRKPEEIFTEVLKNSSKALMDLSTEFSPLAGGFPTMNFYERSLSGSTAVEEPSVLTIPTEENHPICGDNSSICKLPPGDDQIDTIHQKIKTEMSTAPKFGEEEISYLQSLLVLNPETYLPRIPDHDSVTNNWIFSHDKYISWLQSAAPTILCLHGKLGSGKTVLSTLVLKNMRASSFGQKKAIVFFFCDDQDEYRHSTTYLLSSFIRQLLVQQPSLFRYVRDHYKLTRDRSNWTRQELRVLFRGILCSRGQVEIVCIIDGLDRCNSSHMQLWEDLVNLTTTTGATDSPLKFMVTTRTLFEIPTLPESYFSIDIDVQKEVHDDIKGLVVKGIADLVQKHPGFAGFEESITKKLLDCPGATFLTTSLALGDLATLKVRSTPFSIRQKLESLPFGYSEVYERQLQSVSPVWLPWAHEVLSWVLYTVRPLTVDELALALAIAVDSESLSAIQDHISRDMVSDLKQVFGPFISIKGSEVHLIHPTAREFLVSQTGGTSWRVFDPEQVHGRISRMCLTYLSMEEFEGDLSLVGFDGKTPLPQPQWSLLTYAAQHWPTHYKQSGDKESDIHSKVLDFLNRQVEAKLWPRLYWSGVKPIASPPWESAKHIASELGFTEVVMRHLGTASDAERESFLESAARNGHTNLVKQLLETSEDEKEKDKNGTALSEAARNGHQCIVRLLLNSGCNPKLSDGSDTSPLALASRNGHTAVVQIFLTLSVDSVPDYSRSPALRLAAENGHESVVKVLLDTKGIYVEAECTESKYLPLHLAAQRGHVEVVKQLLAHNANPQPSSHPSTPLHLAAKYGHLNIVKQLLTAGANVDPLDDSGSTPLHHAIQSGYEFVVDVLLESGADIERADKQCATPIHLAASSGHVAVVKRLLDAYINEEPRNKSGETPLHLAVQHGHTEVVGQLIESGADTNAKRFDGWTPLHLAAKHGHLDIVKQLLKAGTSIDPLDRTGSTPLHRAAQSGHEIIVGLLLELRADIERTNKKRATPIHLAAGSGHVEVVKRLLDACANREPTNKSRETPLHLAVQHGHTEVVGQLLERGINTNAERQDGWTALHLGVREQNVAEVELLLLNGAKVDAKNSRGSTPLFLAAQLGNKRIAKLLLDKGASAREANRLKSTPLHRASQNGHLDVVKLLLAAGASATAKKDNGLTPLALAQKYPEIAEELAINRQDEKGRTKLFNACAKGIEEDTKTLLEEKEDPNIKDNDGRVPLDVALQPPVRALLLKHITGGTEAQDIKTLDGDPPCSRDQSSHDMYLFCNSCGERIMGNAGFFYYHCCKCDEDYDLCQKCHDDGETCLDDEHNMRIRLRADNIESVSEYSSWVSEMRWPLIES